MAGVTCNNEDEEEAKPGSFKFYLFHKQINQALSYIFNWNSGIKIYFTQRDKG